MANYPESCPRCNYAGPFRICGDGRDDGRYFCRHADGSILCDECCGEEDRRAMVETGRATLYLSYQDYGKRGWLGEKYVSATVSNWPGTLKFHSNLIKVGRHNMAGTRYDVWFKGPDGKDWHGVQYGENTQICHCRRIK